VILEHDIHAEGRGDLLEAGDEGANCNPIIASPTKSRATDRLIRHPRSGSGPIQAKTSGAPATARYTKIQKAL
jgi:hypothetical protein